MQTTKQLVDDEFEYLHNQREAESWDFETEKDYYRWALENEAKIVVKKPRIKRNMSKHGKIEIKFRRILNKA